MVKSADMIDDPLFWICAVAAVLITGVSKGGLGGMAVFAVPLMALTISPVQAAGIMLPILMAMDVFSVWAYRKDFSKKLVLQLLPAAIAGIAVGGLIAGYISDDGVRITVGLIALGFVAYKFITTVRDTGKASWLKDNKLAAMIAGLMAGITSTLAHAGGPPFKIYALPQGYKPEVFAGSAAVFFAVVNAVKLIPYGLLGQLSVSNLTTSMMLIPLAPLGVWAGVWMVRRIDHGLFYKIMYSLLFIVGLRLLWTGLT